MSTDFGKTQVFRDYIPIVLAADIQRSWLTFTVLCHGFLGGLALGHFFFLYSNDWTLDPEFLTHYDKFSNVYTCIFYFFCIVCIISVCDRYDVSHLDIMHLRDLITCRKSSIVIIIYAVCLILHLIAVKTDDRLALLSYYNASRLNISQEEIKYWSKVSYWRSIFATFGWVFVACGPGEDLFYIHLKNMEKYAVTDN